MKLPLSPAADTDPLGARADDLAQRKAGMGEHVDGIGDRRREPEVQTPRRRFVQGADVSLDLIEGDVAVGSPERDAKPELVLASAWNPSAASTFAEPASQGLGMTKGSPS